MDWIERMNEVIEYVEGNLSKEIDERKNCRLRFAITIEGVDKMDYTVMEKSAFKVMGIRRTTPYGGGTWAVVKTDGSNELIKKLSGRFFDLGLCFGFGADGSNDYMCGMEWEGEDVPGFDYFEYPTSTWLKF